MYNKHLETFICVADLGSFSKAAEENFMAVNEPVKHGLRILRGEPMNCAEIIDEKKN